MARNPFLERVEKDARKSQGYLRSPKQERQLAKRTKGTTTSNSGAGKTKGDVRVKGIARIEAKCTQNKSFSVTRDMIEKITNAATFNDEIPAIVIEFLDRDGKPDSEVAVIPVTDLLRLIDHA